MKNRTKEKSEPMDDALQPEAIEDDTYLFGAMPILQHQNGGRCRKVKVDFATLAFRWKPAYGYPLEKINGQPALSMKKYHAWATSYGFGDLAPEKITEEMLHAEARRQRIAKMPDRLLDGINEISEVVNKAPHTVMDWQRSYVDCPIKKTGRNYSVMLRALCIFMNENGITWGRGQGGTTV